jgi:hypothetical protein
MKQNLKYLTFFFFFIFALNISFAQKHKKEKPTSGYDFQGPFCNGLAKVKKNNKWGFIDSTGNVIVQPKYTQVENFNDGLARVRMGSSGGKVGGWGLVDTKGNEIVKPMFEWIYDFVDGKARVKSEGAEGYIDRNGNMVGKKEEK